MKTANNFSTSIHTTLRELIEAKSKRDKIKFTGYQLASAVDMPRSIITKLLHVDKSKRVSNPKIETLIKIVDYFREDGFNISIDELLGITSGSVDVQSQSIMQYTEAHFVKLYSLENIKEKIGTAEINIPQTSKNIIALCAAEDMKPFFKQGSLFIVDLEMKPTHDTLIAIKLDGLEKVHIRKYFQEKNKIILKSLTNEEDITLFPTRTCQILGVVIQINAKT